MFRAVCAVPLGYRILGLAFQAYPWVQTAAFYGIIPAVIYVGAKNTGLSFWDLKKAFVLPLT